MTDAAAAKYRQSLIDEGCKLKMSCAPKERKWRIMVTRDYKTAGERSKEPYRWTRRGGGDDRVSAIGETEAEATANLKKKLEEL